MSTAASSTLVPRITGEHLEALFAAQPETLKQKRVSAILELSAYGGPPGLNLILCQAHLPKTYAGAVRFRGSENGQALGGHFAFEYEGRQFLSLPRADPEESPPDVTFDPVVAGAAFGETLAAIEAFARAHGIPHVRPLPPLTDPEPICHVWLGHDLGALKASWPALEEEWVTGLRGALEEWTSRSGETVRNAVVYLGAELHTGVEVVYVNRPALDVGPERLAGALARGGEALDGAELDLEGAGPSLLGLAPEQVEHADRFLARVCARLADALKLAPGSILAMTHDRESAVDLPLFLEASARLAENATAFVDGALRRGTGPAPKAAGAVAQKAPAVGPASPGAAKPKQAAAGKGAAKPKQAVARKGAAKPKRTAAGKGARKPAPKATRKGKPAGRR
jgi:hypothetical protein